MTDTPLDLDFIEHRMASPMVTYRESVEEDMPALVAALRKAEAQVAAVLALHAPHGRLDDLHCAQHDPGSYPCATARAAGAS